MIAEWKLGRDLETISFLPVVSKNSEPLKDCGIARVWIIDTMWVQSEFLLIL